MANCLRKYSSKKVKPTWFESRIQEFEVQSTLIPQGPSIPIWHPPKAALDKTYKIKGDIGRTLPSTMLYREAFWLCMWHKRRPDEIRQTEGQVSDLLF